MLHNYDNYSLLSSAELTVILEITAHPTRSHPKAPYRTWLAHLVVVVCFFVFVFSFLFTMLSILLVIQKMQFYLNKSA